VRQFSLLIAAVLLSLGLGLAVGGCGKNEAKTGAMDDGKMSTTKSDGKMNDSKMNDGKMDDGKMGTGKMDDSKKGKM
jgi:hypothetical protein